MFTFETRINGTLIHHIYGHNMGRDVRGFDEYEYHFYDVEQGDGKTVSGKVYHKRYDGITRLESLILLDVLDKLNKKNDGLETSKTVPGSPVRTQAS